MDLEELNCSVSLSPVTLLFLLMPLISYTPVEGQIQVIGSLQPIVAALGGNAVLPCHVEPRINVARLTVEWSRPHLRPDPNDRLSRVGYVHLYRDSREVADMKISSYVGRTTLFADGLRQGNISLKIINVTLADEGRYKCFIPKLKSRTKSSFVHLVVEPNSAGTWTTETPLQPRSLQIPDQTAETDDKGGWTSRSRQVAVVVSCIFLLVIGVTAYLTQKYKKRELMKVPTI